MRIALVPFPPPTYSSPDARVDYEGDDSDYEAARSYFKMRFVRLNRSDKKDIYTHATCATDTNAMRVVMASVTECVLSYLGP